MRGSILLFFQIISGFDTEMDVAVLTFSDSSSPTTLIDPLEALPPRLPTPQCRAIRHFICGAGWTMS
jgi:hypothetical protein